MTATIKAPISPFAQAETEFDSNPMHFLNEDLASVPVSGISEEFRKLSRYLPVIVLVPKSAVHDKPTQKKAGPNKSFTGLIDTSDVCLSLDAAKAWLRNPNAGDTFEFGGVTGCFSTMEIHRNGRPEVEQAYAAALLRKTGFEAEFRNVRPDGTIKNIRSIDHPIL